MSVLLGADASKAGRYPVVVDSGWA